MSLQNMRAALLCSGDVGRDHNWVHSLAVHAEDEEVVSSFLAKALSSLFKHGEQTTFSASAQAACPYRKGNRIGRFQAIVDQQTYILREGQELIATFTLAASQTEWDRHIWGEDASESSLYLHRLALHPATMRKGLGANLLTWITQLAANGQKNLRLDCVADNPRLNQFYQRNGFHLLGTTDGHHKWQKSVEPRA